MKLAKMSWSFKLSAGFLALIIILAIIIPMFSNLDPNGFDPNCIGEPAAPSIRHIFGTDDLGRDILLRLIYGARVSLTVGLVSVGIMIFVGIFVGTIAGYLGGWVDELIMRFVDVFMAIPTIFLILTIQILLKPSIYNVMFVIGLTSWTGVSRLVRAEILSIKERPFITAAYARGISHLRVLIKHILPHALNPIIVASMLGMGTAILTESVLSYLGLGIQPPHASWGNMLENSLSFMIDAPWMAIAPGVLISLTVLSLNFLGDFLRSGLNPRESK
jgi:peptide/nickel transport system permease protein